MKARSALRAVVFAVTTASAAVLPASAGAVTTPPTVGAAAVFAIAAGGSAPLGDITVTESAPGQLQVGNVLTYRFSDAVAGSTLHFATAGTVSGTNGLAATVAVASSSGTLDDEMTVTITATSASSAFPGVLTLSGLTATADSTAATGNDSVAVSGTVFSSPVTTTDATVITGSASRATYAAQSTPTVLPTDGNQAAGIVTITEPVKSYFHVGDVITFNVRDATGSANTVGLATSPYAGGGSMTVAVSGLNGPAVQVNDSGFKVAVTVADPSEGSASTITVSNIVLDTAQAPLGPVTLSAAVTAGPDAGSALMLPGRVKIANVGGTTTTTSSGAPSLAVGVTGQVAANVTLAATAGSLIHNDVITLAVTTPGVTFNATTLPVATVTSGDLVLDNATATLGTGDTSASWTVQIGNLEASTMVVGPILYDVSTGATPGSAVSLLVSGESGSAVTTQSVTNAVVSNASPPGAFTVAQPPPSVATAPFAGGSITYTETAAGATAPGSSIVLVSPYATQISAYRATFAAVPTAVTSNGLTLGPATVNSSTVLVATPQGTISAPPQTVVTFPVTAASSGSPGTADISNLTFTLGSLVPPGAMLVSGVIVPSGGSPTPPGNQVVDLVDTHNLGTSSANTPPVVTLTQTPQPVSGTSTATFAYISDEAGSTFACALDATVISLNCPASITLPSLTDGRHTFSVQAFNSSNIGSAVVNYTWTIDTVPPTATLAAPSSLADAVTVKFSAPVQYVGSATVTLEQVPASGAPVPMAGSLSCTPSGGSPGPCQATLFYTSVSIQPASALVAGEHYAVVLDPSHVTPPITNQAGNSLATATTLAFRGTLSDPIGAPGTSPRWSTVKATSASGGSYVEDHLKGASASFTFTGTAVTWETVTGPNQGKAAVYIDGTLVKTVSNYATATSYKVARAFSGLTNAAHTIEVVVLGQKSTSSATDDEVAVDAFAVGATTTEQSSAAVTYQWSVVAAKSGAPAYAVDDAKGASYGFSFRGTGITWYAVVGPTMGKAAVYVDGTLKATINDGAKSVAYNKARAITGLGDGEHQLTIVVLGSHTTVSSGNAVAIEKFLVS